MQEMLWVAVVVVAVLLVVAFIVRAISNRRGRPSFRTRSLPVGYFSAYQTRIQELQAMFVNQPREAVAGAKHMVDDLMMRLGYPTRLDERERMRDLAHVHRPLAEHYKAGVALKSDSTTEDLRRALQHYLDLARGLMDRAQPEHEEPAGRREIAG